MHTLVNWQLAGVLMSIVVMFVSIVLHPLHATATDMVASVLAMSALASFIAINSVEQNVAAFIAALAFSTSQWTTDPEPVSALAVLGFCAAMFLTGIGLAGLVFAKGLSYAWVMVGTALEAMAVGVGVLSYLEPHTRTRGIAFLGGCSILLVALQRLTVVRPAWFERPKAAEKVSPRDRTRNG